MKKLIIFSAIVLQCLAYAGPPISACTALFEGRTYDTYFKALNDLPDDVMVNGVKVKEEVGKIVKKFTGKEFNGNTFEDAIDAVYAEVKLINEAVVSAAPGSVSHMQRIRNFFGLGGAASSGTPQVFRAQTNVMSAFAKEAIEKVKTIKFKVAQKIFDIENFKPSEFKKVGKEKFLATKGNNFEQLTHMQLDEYENYTESWVMRNWKGTDHEAAQLFESIDQGSLGVISVRDIRDIESYNLWPMYLKEHDMRHIHYGYSHPMALGVMMKSARSKEHLRFVMMGSIYEGVDRVQYSHETAINKWFSQSIGASDIYNIDRNMDLEEAMITLAISSEDDLWKVAKAMGHESKVKGWVDELDGWVPKKVDGTDFDGKALNGKSLEEDVDNMLKKYSDYVQKGELARRKLLEDGTMELTEEQELFMKMQNYQLNPENPEIVIDGLRYKNDGRGHYSGDSGNGAPIGIGDS
jgi:hypothetical protein